MLSTKKDLIDFRDSIKWFLGLGERTKFER
jgi:hypothetical protein